MSHELSTENQEVLGTIAIETIPDATELVKVGGYWVRNASVQPVEEVIDELNRKQPKRVVTKAEALEAWDSRLPSYLLKIAEYRDC